MKNKVFIFAILFTFSASTVAADTTTTTIYPSKYYNTDGATATKHIFANGVEAGTVTGTGSEAVPRYVHTDQLTGSNVVSNATDTIDETLDYFPFGGIRIDSGSYSDQRKYAGSEFDGDTQLNYLGARYYSSDLGRLISQDPEFLSANPDYLLDPQQWNSYSYARNNPLGYIDSDGKKAEIMVRAIPWTLHLPFIGTINAKIPGAHGAIIITSEPDEDLSQYGTGPRYSIGGYDDSSTLRARLNDPRDLNYPESRYLTTIPLSPPTGMSVSEYDQKLLESGSNLAQGINGTDNLGSYFFTGQPISNKPNSGNTTAQIIINAGGTVPPIKNAYPGPAPYFRYLPLGLGNPLGTPSYVKQTVTAIKNSVASVKSTITSTISKTFSFFK